MGEPPALGDPPQTMQQDQEHDESVLMAYNADQLRALVRQRNRELMDRNKLLAKARDAIASLQAEKEEMKKRLNELETKSEGGETRSVEAPASDEGKLQRAGREQPSIDSSVLEISSTPEVASDSRTVLVELERDRLAKDLQSLTSKFDQMQRERQDLFDQNLKLDARCMALEDQLKEASVGLSSEGYFGIDEDHVSEASRVVDPRVPHQRQQSSPPQTHHEPSISPSIQPSPKPKSTPKAAASKRESPRRPTTNSGTNAAAKPNARASSPPTSRNSSVGSPQMRPRAKTVTGSVLPAQKSQQSANTSPSRQEISAPKRTPERAEKKTDSPNQLPRSPPPRAFHLDHEGFKSPTLADAELRLQQLKDKAKALEVENVELRKDAVNHAKLYEKANKYREEIKRYRKLFKDTHPHVLSKCRKTIKVVGKVLDQNSRESTPVTDHHDGIQEYCPQCMEGFHKRGTPDSASGYSSHGTLSLSVTPNLATGGDSRPETRTISDVIAAQFHRTM